MNLFSKDSHARLKTLFSGRAHGISAGLKERLRMVSITAGGSLAIPLLLVFGAEWVRGKMGSGDADVVLWWPTSEWHFTLPLLCGLLAALGLGVAALLRGAVTWPVVRRVWAGLAVAALASAVLSIDSSVRIYADRVVLPDSRTLRFDTADAVQTSCRIISRRRQSDYATIDYLVQFPDGTWVDLGEARSQGPEAARAWFRTVSNLDATVLGGVPHTPYEADGVNCIRSLRLELAEADFIVARRMMGIGDEAFIRRYSEPHEAWNAGRVPAKSP